MTHLRKELERGPARSEARRGPGIGDELFDSFPNSRFGSSVQAGLRRVTQNPLAAMLIATAAGWLVYSMSKKRGRNSSWRRRMGKAEETSVLNTGHARVYDPDASSRHPTQDLLESRREMSARI